MSFQAAVNVSGGANGDATVVDPKIHHFRFENLKSTDDESKIFAVQFHLPLGEVAKGDKIRIAFEAKADKE